MRKTGVEVEERNFAKEALTRKELNAIVAAAPSMAQLINTRHKVAKEHGWKEKPPSKTAFIKAAMAEPNVMRRPVLLHAGAAVIGKDGAAIVALLTGK